MKMIQNLSFAHICTEAKEGGEEKKKAAGPVQLVDPKVGQNLSIWLSRFKCSLQGVVDGIRNLDESMFEKDQLKALIPLLPSKEDVRTLISYFFFGTTFISWVPYEKEVHLVGIL